jgi:hypothetical protein
MVIAPLGAMRSLPRWVAGAALALSLGVPGTAAAESLTSDQALGLAMLAVAAGTVVAPAGAMVTTLEGEPTEDWEAAEPPVLRRDDDVEAPVGVGDLTLGLEAPQRRAHRRDRAISPPRGRPSCRSFWQASATAHNLSAWPRALRSASKLTFPEGSTRRLMAWIWPTSSRSRGSVTSRR